MAQRSPACATRTAAARAGRLRRISSSTPPGAAPLPSLCYNRSAGRCQRRPPLASISAMRHASLPSQTTPRPIEGRNAGCVGVAVGGLSVCGDLQAKGAANRGKPLSAAAVGCGAAAASAASLERRRSALLDPGRPMVQRLASSVADCETGNSSSLAASGLEGVLEVAILS
jgi:hypothetical protein